MQSHIKKFRNATLTATLIATMGLFTSTSIMAADMPKDADNFYQSTQVTIQKVKFKNQYNMNVVGNLVMNRTGFVGDQAF